MRRGLLSFVAGICLLCARPASADVGDPDADARSHARSLAEEAATLLDGQHYADALDRATRAEQLYHASSNVLLMAEAQEGLGHLAAAVETYERLVAEPLPPSSPKPFLVAQQTGNVRLRTLLARVPSLLVSVLGGPAPAAVVTTVDGRQVATRGGVAIRLDPGPHQVSVVAEGYRPFEQVVTLPDRGGVTVVEAALTSEANPAAPQAPTTSAPAAALAPVPTEHPSHLGAALSFSVGGAGIVVGAITGILSLGKVSDLKTACPGSQCPASEGSVVDSAKTLGTVSTIGFVVGGLGVAAGTVLLLIHPSRAPSTARSSAGPTVTPWIGMGGAGLAGRF